MTTPQELQGKSRDEIEAWFFTAVESEAMPVGEMLAVLKALGGSQGGTQICGWAELLQDALASRQMQVEALQLLTLRCKWSGDAPSFGSVCKKAARATFSSRLGKAFVKNVGFGSDVKPSESLRRLEVLSQLEKGALCYERTWGFGSVKRLDDFYERVVIDFKQKPRHEMSLAYAAETLELIGSDHLLARLHQDTDALKALVKDDAAEIVRITLRSYGFMSALDLKDRLIDDAVLTEPEWKSFWDSARRALKSDPLVNVPTRRAEPITLLGSPDEHIKSQFSDLLSARAPEHIIKKADELEAGGVLKNLSPENATMLANQLAFAMWGAEGKHPDWVARALLMALRFNLVGEDGLLGERKANISQTIESLLVPKTLQLALTKLPVRAMGGLLDYCRETVPEALSQNLIPLIPKLSISVTTEAIAQVRKAGFESDLQNFVADVLTNRKGTPSLLLWVFRNPEFVAELFADDPAELLRQGIEVIEWPEAGYQLTAQHQIRSLFETGAWLSERMAPLSHEQRVVLLARIQSCRGWDETGRRSVVAGIIKQYPELHEAIQAAAAAVEQPKTRLTSWRSYRERQAQLKKLVEEELPENSREIAVARSYGDLRENSEYKYAKEHQRILHCRQDEMESDLDAVHGTDFSGCEIDKAGLATTVSIRRPNGDTNVYCVLGEFDRDEGLNIISSLSRLAELLEGHGVGDTVDLPGEAGDEPCEITGVEGLSDAVHAWLND